MKHSAPILTALLLACSNPPETSDDAASVGDLPRSPDLGAPDLFAAVDAELPDLAAPPDCPGFSPVGDKLTLTVAHNGTTRTAVALIPKTYDAKTPVGVVLNFHGYSSNATQQSLYSLMGTAGPAAGFVVIHPEGTGTVQSWNAGLCCGTAATGKVDDVGFVTALLDELAKQVCVDPRRVHAAGMSNGGMFSYTLACKLADRIASIAPVAGVLLQLPCTPSRPVPTFHFHGTADTVVKYDGDKTKGWTGAMASVQKMATDNGCIGSAQQYLQKGDVTCIRWDQGCKQGAEVRLCTVDQGGHTWPGGLNIPIPGLGTMTQEISATNEALAFFKSHPIPGAP